MSEFFQKGMEAYREGQYDKAVEFLINASENDDQNPKIWNALGVSLSKLGNNTDAESCFENAILLDPGNSTFKKNLEQTKIKNDQQSNQKKLKKLKNSPKNNFHYNDRAEYRDPYIPLILSIFFPGVGQVYNGAGGLAGFIRNIATVIGYFCLFFPGLILHIYYIHDAFTTRKKMNNGEIPAEYGTVRDYLIFFIVIPIIIALIIMASAVMAAFVFGVAGNVEKTKMVAFTAESNEDNIIITYHGGKDSNQIEKIFVSLNSGPQIDKTNELKRIGSSMSIKKETNKDHVVIVIQFTDGRQQVAMDTYV